MASETRITTDHDQIRRWAEEHRGKPVSVRGTESGDNAGVLRIDFPGGSGDDQPGADWFAKFESSSLAVLYQEKKASGEDSRSSSSSLADSTPEATEGTEPLVAVDVFH